jgi:hypothetical protein
MQSTVRHIGNITKSDRPLVIQAYISGYYIVFEDTPAGLLDLKLCARRLDGERLFGKYTIRAEAFPKGQEDVNTPKQSLPAVLTPLNSGSGRKLGDEMSVGTPSTTSSGTKVPKCHVCKGRAEDEPLVECQTTSCTRRYHRHCLGTAVPEDPNEWRCPRCVRKGATLSSKRSFAEFVASEDQGERNASSKDKGEAAFKKLRLDDRQEDGRKSTTSVNDRPRLEDSDITRPEPRSVLDEQGGSVRDRGEERHATPIYIPGAVNVASLPLLEGQDPEASQSDQLVDQSFTSAGSKPNGNITDPGRSSRFKYTKTKLPHASKDNEDVENVNAVDPVSSTAISSPRADDTHARDQASSQAQQKELHASPQFNRDPLNKDSTTSIMIPDSLSCPAHPSRSKTPEEDPAFAAFTRDLAKTTNESSNRAPSCTSSNVEARPREAPVRRGVFRKKAPTLPDVDLCSQCKIAKVPRRPGADAPLCLLCKKSDPPLEATNKSAVNGVNNAEALAAQSFNRGNNDVAGHPKTNTGTIAIDTQTDAAHGKGKSSKSGKLPIFSSDEIEAAISPQARPSTSKGGSTRQRKVITRPSQRRQALSTFDLGDSYFRPSLAYERLMGMVLLAAPGHRVQVVSVPQWIHDNIPGYDMYEGKWAGGIKATMCLNAQGKYGKQLSTRVKWEEGDGGLNESDWYVLLPELIGKIDRWDPVNKLLVRPNGESGAIGEDAKQDRAVNGLGIFGIGDAIVISDDDEDESNGGDAAAADVADDDHDMPDHNSGNEADNRRRTDTTGLGTRSAEIEGPRAIPAVPRQERLGNGVVSHDHRHSREPSPKPTGESSTGRLPRLSYKRNHGLSHEAETIRNKSASGLGSRSPNGRPSEPKDPSTVHPNPRLSRKTARTTTLPVRGINRPSVSSMSTLPNHHASSSSKRPSPPLPPPPPTVEKPKLTNSFFTTWPEYLPVDPDVRIQQIAKRPSRKQLFGKSPLHSRLTDTAEDTSLNFHFQRTAPPTTTISVHTSPTKPPPVTVFPSGPPEAPADTPDTLADPNDNNNNPNDPSTWRSDATSLQHCASAEDFFGLNHPDVTTLVPMVSGGELCFKREVDAGRRAKVLYHTGV